MLPSRFLQILNLANSDHPTKRHNGKETRKKDTPTKSYLAGVVDPTSSRLGKYDGTLHVRGFKLGIIEKLSDRVLHGVISREGLRYEGWPEEPEGGDFPLPVDSGARSLLTEALMVTMLRDHF
ncbi:hypothetical protein BGZ57DRAFT_1010711 [Hyaloscypha finlandica]|nr:hypothetical protein BGZ57DRAFT_1010711 [Hyaloscypha finlandica]